MFAGVHYYSDHYWGLKFGEQIAVGMMRDVFDQVYTGGEEITPTFTTTSATTRRPETCPPTLFEDLRANATSR